MRWNSVLLMTIGILLEFGMIMLSGKRPRLRSFFVWWRVRGPGNAGRYTPQAITNTKEYKILFCMTKSYFVRLNPIYCTLFGGLGVFPQIGGKLAILPFWFFLFWGQRGRSIFLVSLCSPLYWLFKWGVLRHPPLGALCFVTLFLKFLKNRMTEPKNEY